MAKKLQDRLLEALLKSGETVVKQLTGCIVVSRKKGGYYYIGKAGSLRFGETRQSSIPCSIKLRQVLLNG